LLAPTGAELWRYEEALERRGIPVATQAGKSLFRRQEVQDLIAVTGVLADRRDTLALGALLRGPLVGLTEEALLDMVWALPRSEEEPDRIPRLDLGVDPAVIGHPLARDIFEKLQSLYRRGNSTTPHELLSQAVDYSGCDLFFLSDIVARPSVRSPMSISISAWRPVMRCAASALSPKR
jgi:ATP-dependent exoDNAse (exonuclease V) beta subunit